MLFCLRTVEIITDANEQTEAWITDQHRGGQGWNIVDRPSIYLIIWTTITDKNFTIVRHIQTVRRWDISQNTCSCTTVSIQPHQNCTSLSIARENRVVTVDMHPKRVSSKTRIGSESNAVGIPRGIRIYLWLIVGYCCKIIITLIRTENNTDEFSRVLPAAACSMMTMIIMQTNRCHISDENEYCSEWTFFPLNMKTGHHDRVNQ